MTAAGALAPADRGPAASLVISLDLEFGWGHYGGPRFDVHRPLYRETRTVVRRLLELFDRHEAPATWAVVGKLVDPDGPAAGDAASRAERDAVDARSIFYAPETLDQIRAAEVAHDIGSHSYHHTVFGAPDLSAEAARADLDQVVDLHRRLGLPTTSFVFPKNSIGHLDRLRDAGVRVYRGRDLGPARMASRQRARVHNLLNDLLMRAPAAVTPRHADGLIELPGSMLFRLPFLGPRRHMPAAVLAMRGRRGLDAAVAQGGAFHLWFHPFNFAYRLDDHLRALGAVLAHADRLRADGRLAVRTMADYAG